jgi:hypothetical protein
MAKYQGGRENRGTQFYLRFFFDVLADVPGSKGDWK